MRPVLALFVGTRGIPVTDLCRSLESWTDVVVVTADEVIARRPDRIAAGGAVLAVVTSPTVAGMEAAARRYADQHRIDGAMTVSDDAVEVTAMFSAGRGLPGLRTQTVAAFRDKFVQRSLLAEGGLPVPAFAELSGPSSVADALRNVPLPAILKPTRSSGGVLAHVISTADELATTLIDALAGVENSGGAVDPGSAFILEGLLRGIDSHPVGGFAPYVSVETLAHGDQLHHLAVTDRFPVSPPTLETGMMLPSCLSQEAQQPILEAAAKALRVLGFRDGMAHTELMLTADGPRVIEVNARVGGALPYLFPLAGELDVIEQAARVALGLAPVTTPAWRRAAVFIAPQHPVGVRVQSVDGLEAVSVLPGVRTVLPMPADGVSTDAFRSTMIAAVLATVPDAVAAVALWRAVMHAVRPRYDATAGELRYSRAPAALVGTGGPDAVIDALPHVLGM